MMLVLDVAAAGVNCEVDLNDIPIFAHRGFEPAQQTAKIDNWALPGGNELTLRIGRLPARGDMTASGKPLPAPKVTVVLRRTAPGADAATDRILASFSWPTGQAVPLSLSTVWKQSIDLGSRPLWRWARASATPVASPADRSEIMAQLRQIVAALEARDRPRTIEAQRLSISENAESMGLPPAEVLDDYNEFLAERMSAGWLVEPLAEAALEMRSAGGGRLIHVVAADGRPAISTDSEAGYFGIDPWMAKLDGKWTLVR